MGPLSASASIGEGARATAQEAERVYAMLHDVLMKAVNYRCVCVCARACVRVKVWAIYINTENGTERNGTVAPF